MASGRPDSFAVPNALDPVVTAHRADSMREHMSPPELRMRRVAALGALLVSFAALFTLGPANDRALAASGGLHVSGNQLLDGSGNVVHFHGVDRSGTEYACIQGWGLFDGPSDDASVAAIASWHANFVHIGLNEDCILGINGVAPQYAGANYMNAVVNFVKLVHAHGMYAEVNIFWAAAGTATATGQLPLLDADHGAAALQAMANAFKNDPNTILGVTEEPHGVSWACWLNGGSSCSLGYTALGMQGAVNAIRSTGAQNVIEVSGRDYANDLSQWLTYKPSDPLGQLVAQGDFYGNNTCGTPSCFDSTVAPVAAKVPVIMGEIGETYDDSSSGTTNTQAMVGWADSHGVGYAAWTWDTWGTALSLISNYNGTPANAYGTWIRSHYLTFPAPGLAPPPVATPKHLPTDFNGDGRADVAVFRPSTGFWFLRGIGRSQWGVSGDVPVPADYNGDGKSDLAVFRPSTGYWYVQGVGSFQWGVKGDVPVPADYNGDGKADIAVFRPSTGYWYLRGIGLVQWGRSGDVPVPADYNGDGKADVAVFRPSNGYWFLKGIGLVQWGRSGDVAVPADYNGDGKADVAVFRPSNGYWFLHGVGLVQWGRSGDVPVPADYNGDGKADVAVFRPGNDYWFQRGLDWFLWGDPGDTPVRSVSGGG